VTRVARRNGSDENVSIGRRLSTWRRLMLSFGPLSAKRVALAMSEFAWPEGGDPDGELLVRHCTNRILCRLCDYKSPRGLLRQIAVLEDAGWLGRDDVQTGPNIHREYVLLVPASVSASAIEALTTPSRGMWDRVFQANSERTGESQDTRYSEPDAAVDDTETDEQVNSSTDDGESGELESTNRWPGVHEQVNSGSPLKESSTLSQGVSTSKEVSLSGNQQARSENDGTTDEHVSNRLPDHDHGEPVLQQGKPEQKAERDDYRRRAVIELNDLGYKPKEIARQARLSVDDVRKILQAEPV